ncbi:MULTISPECIES: hypothetical protein [unclassified Nesterenkonia]|uniref:hypothetical protein n=1 Tax=unclassified Nesterenkonia TaxID=2629769 RepID=UPI000873233B|nr:MULTISPECIES: hypothetical protein [unclassified Nesterenkonia]MDS2172427.1 hypothetical protein [Nesterenkonia sp. CL21]OSM44520.1 hypothetical protein BCY76_002165 [Nesterenkonia sp. PF2B19]
MSAEAATEQPLSEDARDVIVALLGQQEALLAELRWAYDQLERTQEADIAELRSRVAKLEHRVAARRQAPTPPVTGSSPDESPASRMRRRLESAVQDPERTVRAASRRVRRQVGKVARRAGISR